MAQTQPKPNFSKIVSHPMSHEKALGGTSDEIFCVFSVFHCVESSIWRGIGGYPRNEDGAPRRKLKVVVVVFGSSLVNALDVLYFSCAEAPHTRWTIKAPGLESYKLLVGQKYSFKLSLVSIEFPEKTFKLIKKTPVYKFPGV